MAIIRRDDIPDTFAPKVLYLWRRKWLILFATAAAFILTYLGMLAVPQEFQANAQVYVNRLAVFQDNQLNPVTVATIIKSDEVLLKVRDVVAQKYRLDPLPPVEKFVKQFRVKTEILQDTSVQKNVSPVITLGVSGPGREETQFMMQAWLDVITRDYANVGVMESVSRLEALKKQNAIMEAELTDAEKRQAEYATQVPVYEHMLAELVDYIAPTRLERPELPQRSISQPVPDAGSRINMQVQVTNPTQKGPGLLTKLAETELNVARWGRDENAETSAGVQHYRDEALLLSGFIDDRMTSIVHLQAKAADVRQKLNSATREVDMKTAQQRELHRFMDQVAVVAALRNVSDSGGGDLRVLTRPALPDLRVWPKRTLAALVVAIGVFVLTIVALLAHHYLQETARRYSTA